MLIHTHFYSPYILPVCPLYVKEKPLFLRLFYTKNSPAGNKARQGCSLFQNNLLRRLVFAAQTSLQIQHVLPSTNGFLLVQNKPGIALTQTRTNLCVRRQRGYRHLYAVSLVVHQNRDFSLLAVKTIPQGLFLRFYRNGVPIAGEHHITVHITTIYRRTQSV